MVWKIVAVVMTLAISTEPPATSTLTTLTASSEAPTAANRCCTRASCSEVIGLDRLPHMRRFHR